MSTTTWGVVPLGDVLIDLQAGFASGVHNTTGVGIPHLRPMNVTTDGRIDRRVLKYVSPDAGRPSIRLRRGDVLFNNTNSTELVGKTALFDEQDTPAFSNHMTRLRVNPERADSGYIALKLHQSWREGWFATHCNNHVSQASIGRDVLGAFELELPPLEVQRAIVALASDVVSRRESSLEHLRTAESLVDRFRQAVMAAACSGRITGDWRLANPEITTVEVALATATSAKSRKRPQPNALGIDVPEFPDSYVVSTVREAAELIEYGTSQRAEHGAKGIAVLRMGNIQDGVLDFADLKFCALDAEIERLILADGDLLFNRTNSPELVGKTAVFHGSESMTFASYIIRVRFDPSVADPDFVGYWINSAWGRLWASQVKTDGVSQSNINGTKLGNMPLPLPPIAEQREIVRRVEAALVHADSAAVRVAVAQRGAERITEAVLARAFRGELLLSSGQV